MTRRIVAIVDDMFFAAKIRATAQALGIDVQIVRNTDAALEALRREPASLIIVDLHAKACDPFSLATDLKSEEKLKTIPLMGFFSHVQTALKDRAEAAGFDQVVPRSYFTTHLAEILAGEV
jgi:PleD family two-component response regulator